MRTALQLRHWQAVYLELVILWSKISGVTEESKAGWCKFFGKWCEQFKSTSPLFKPASRVLNVRSNVNPVIRVITNVRADMTDVCVDNFHEILCIVCSRFPVFQHERDFSLSNTGVLLSTLHFYLGGLSPSIYTLSWHFFPLPYEILLRSQMPETAPWSKAKSSTLLAIFFSYISKHWIPSLSRSS